MPPRKSLLIAYLLWGFLGGFGAHRFYLGRPWSGLAMATVTLVLAFTPIWFLGWIWLVVDMFLIPRIRNAAVERVQLDPYYLG